MRKGKSRHGRLAKALIPLFVVSFILSLLCVIVLGVEGDVTDTPEYKAKNYNSSTTYTNSNKYGYSSGMSTTSSYALTTITNIEGAGTYTRYSSRYYYYNQSVTLTASANEGYVFAGWYDGETQVSSNVSYSFAMPAKNISLIAKFLLRSSQVPSDAKYWNNHYYKVYFISKSWKEAKAYCEDLGGHLATITSADEQTFIKTFSTGRYWLGGTDEAKEGTWKWITGESWSYTNWGSGEPNGGTSENYLAIWPTTWNDLTNQSGEQSGFICEWESATSSEPNNTEESLLALIDNSSVGDYVTYGAYPQARVSNGINENLTTLYASTLPTQSNNNGWTVFEYYNVEDMYYKDVVHTDGNKYRAVYFTSYRTTYEYQKSNGYLLSTVYWFKYEPIRWKVLAITDDDIILHAEKNLDNEVFNVGENNYKDSQIRAWLNECFYNSAFSEAEKNYISSYEIEESSNTFSDKVWLLSIPEKRQYYSGGTVKSNTDYSNCMDIYYNGRNTCGWWTRTTNGASQTWHIGYAGDEYSLTKDDPVGVAPAIKISKKN